MSTTTQAPRIPLMDESNLIVKAMNWYTRRKFARSWSRPSAWPTTARC